MQSKSLFLLFGAIIGCFVGWTLVAYYFLKGLQWTW